MRRATHQRLGGPRFGTPALLRYAVSPDATLRGLVERHGDPFRIETLFGELFVSGRPDVAATFLGAPPGTFGGFGQQAAQEMLGPTSVMLAGGAEHRRLRTLLSPCFGAATSQRHATNLLALARRAAARAKSGERFCALDLARRIALDAITTAVVGHGGRKDALGRALAALVSQVTPLLFFVPWLRQAPVLRRRWRGFQRAAREVDAWIATEERRRLGTCDRRPPDDALDVMLVGGLRGRELRDQVVTLLLAGYDTSACVVAWTLFELAVRPRMADRLRSELRDWDGSAETLPKVRYLDAVVHEMLRLHPPATEVFRTLQRPLTLAGHQLPSGSGVALSVALLHQDARIYPSPRVCRPERFLDDRPPSHAFLPFGGGGFRCLGAPFAMLEIKAVVAAFTQQLRWLSVGPPPASVRHHFIVGPREPVWLEVSCIEGKQHKWSSAEIRREG
jgi:cytochrome P450